MARVLIQALFVSSTLSLALMLLLIFDNIGVEGRSVGMFVFGDSFYDIGNTNYLSTPEMHANIPPYGETFFKNPTGRFCDGRLIHDFIAHGAQLPTPLPYLHPGMTSYENGVVFACAGAGALTETNQGTTINLKTQLENYKKVIVKLRQQYGHGNSNKILSEAVYLFNIGTNDYLYPLSTNSSGLKPQYVSLVVGNITMAIKEVYRLGGRKFGINNVGPLGCFPVAKGGVESNYSCLQYISDFAVLHNLQLSRALSGLAKGFKGFKYGLFDMYSNLEKRIHNPTKYGFTESKAACCGSGAYRGIFSCGGQGNLTTYELCDNPEEYVFWDAVHPSDMTYKQLADLVWMGSSSDIGPYNVKTLFHMPN